MPSPLSIMNTTSGGREFETGHMARMLRALTISDNAKLLMGPTISQRYPKPTRPRADEMLKTASNMDPIVPEIPSDLE